MQDVITKRISLQSSATATGNGTAMNVTGFDHALVSVEGISGDTITFEATENESDWYSVYGVNLATMAQGTTATADGLYIASILGATKFRARISTYSAGTIIVNARAGKGNGITPTSLSVTVDTEFPTAAALADGVANYTTPTLAAANLGFNGTTWDRGRSGAVSNVATATGFADSLIVGQYNATPPAITDTRYNVVQLDSAGRLKVVNTTAGDLNTVTWGWDGAANRALGVAVDDSGMVATPVMLPVGGEYRSSATTYTDGDATVLQTDVSGNLKVTLATQIAGEDLTNDVLKVEHRFSYSAVAVADTQVKASAGFLHTVTISCNDAAPTAGSLIIYDNTAESGTVVFNHTFTTTPFVPFTVILDCVMATGIYVGLTTTNDVNFSCSYR